ncbi:hypothetical protein ABN362_17230, partial [Providencia alcalifaciens]
SLRHLCCSEVSISPLFRWPNLLNHYNFMLQYPILINRPIVVTPVGTKLYRPSEVVLDILPHSQQREFIKEDGEIIVDKQGIRVK